MESPLLAQPVPQRQIALPVIRSVADDAFGSGGSRGLADDPNADPESGQQTQFTPQPAPFEGPQLMSRRPRSEESKTLDARIGARLGRGRQLRGLSQFVVAEQVGLTAQQLQKYEHGANRIGAGQLLQFSQVLGLPVGFFYEGLESDQPVIEDALQSSASNRLLRDWPALPQSVQTATLDLVRVLAELHRPEDGTAVVPDPAPEAVAPVVSEGTAAVDAAQQRPGRRRQYGAVWDPADVKMPRSGGRTPWYDVGCRLRALGRVDHEKPPLRGRIRAGRSPALPDLQVPGGRAERPPCPVFAPLAVSGAVSARPRR